ncbi:MAG: hypothetical protein HY097_05550 [Nitrospinae bacterium]|nr:hypothetical protein [Nitrospinota bacterium]MBI3815336.1 hypothetical protein [Nitrospinota bacterium]
MTKLSIGTKKMGLSFKHMQYDVSNEIVIERIKQVLSDFKQKNPHLSNLFKISREFAHKTNDEQVIISDILEIAHNQHLDVLEGSIVSIYYAQARPNLRCPVAFDHPLDHYPMLKLLEIGRQLGIAVCHKFNHVPLTGFMFIVNCIFGDFNKFTELDIPLELIEIDIGVKYKKGILSQKVSYFMFFQKGAFLGYGGGNFSIFPNMIYKELRIFSRCSILENIGWTKTERGDIAIPTNIDLLREI